MTKKRSTKPKQPKIKKRKKSRALVPLQPQRDSKTLPSNSPWATNDRDQLLGDLPGIKLQNEAEVLFHLQRIDPRLADAWRRDVTVHEGPITLRRVMDPVCFGGATHYAYVDHRLLWYLKHDSSDPLGACWDGYLKSVHDAPQGTIAVAVGSNIVVKKCLPQLKEGSR